MNSIGIDLDGDSINIAILNKNKDLVDFKSFDFKELNNSDVNPLYIFNQKKSRITTGLEIQDVLIKNISFDVKKTFSTKKAVKFQNDFITSIDSSKTISVPIIIKEESILKFFITTKEFLKKHLNKLNSFNIDPDYVSCTAMALCRFASYFYNDTKNAFLVHIGQCKTSCVFMKNNMPEKTFNIKLGCRTLIDEFEGKKIKTPIDILLLKHSSLYEKAKELKNEIQKALFSFTNNSNDKYPLILTGDIESLLNFDKFLENEKMSLCLFNEKLQKKPELKLHAISIGLALNSFSTQEIQFRNEEFTCEKKLINHGKQILFFCFFIIFLLSTFYLISSSLINTKEKFLSKNFNQLLTFEKDELNLDETINLKNLYDDLDEYEKKITKQTKEFPYFLKVPNVSQTLSWLNSSEYLKDTEMISFNYELQKYPNIDSKNEPYSTKIDVEFKTKTPSIARNFYDSLIKAEGLVDPKEEITWEVSNDHYKTSFYLKPIQP